MAIEDLTKDTNIKDLDQPSTPSSEAWYKDGLRFKCTECGKCCSGFSGFVWVTEEEMQAIADSLNMPLDLFKRKYTRLYFHRHSLIEKRNEDNACIFLEGKRCSIYNVRPKQCRSFPWWRSNLQAEENWKEAAKHCEGINENAPLVPYSEIVQLRSLDDSGL